MLYSVIIISIGASCGAILRWFLSQQFNALLLTIPLGTLMANWLGGYAMGLVMGLLNQYSLISYELRLLIITGFLGGLTTFSTFSAEVVSLLQENQIAWALGCISLHVLGSILFTLLGIATINYLYF